jgi:hypothetical protein
LSADRTKTITAQTKAAFDDLEAFMEQLYDILTVSPANAPAGSPRPLGKLFQADDFIGDNLDNIL